MIFFSDSFLKTQLIKFKLKAKNIDKKIVRYAELIKANELLNERNYIEPMATFEKTIFTFEEVLKIKIKMAEEDPIFSPAVERIKVNLT
jgi:hypothetical protein